LVPIALLRGTGEAPVATRAVLLACPGGGVGARPPHSQTGLPTSALGSRRKAEVHDYERLWRPTYGSEAWRLRLYSSLQLAESPLARTGRWSSFTLRLSTPFPWGEISLLGIANLLLQVVHVKRETP